MSKVQMKLDELKIAIMAATSSRFCHKYGQPLLEGFENMLGAKGDIAKSAAFIAALESLASFQICPKPTLVKALGPEGSVLLDVVEKNKTFYSYLRTSFASFVPFAQVSCGHCPWNFDDSFFDTAHGNALGPVICSRSIQILPKNCSHSHAVG